MALTDTQKQTIMRAINPKLRGVCPQCKDHQIDIMEELVAIPIAQVPKKGSPFALPDGNIPAVVVCCKNCGLMSFHSLDKLGILDEISE